MERHFRILDVGATLRGPDEILAPIAVAYGRFASDDAGPGALRVSLEAPDARTLSIDGEPVELVPGVDVTLQVYQRFLTRLMDRIGSHAVLHAGALVGRDGNAVVLAAPSGHGKSSLTLELARRGFGFLSDDYAPLDLERRRVHPYPRTTAIVPRPDAPIPEPFRTHALDPNATRMFGKSLLDVGRVLGEHVLAAGPAPLGDVLLLASHASRGGARPATTRIDFAVRSDDAAGIERRLEETRGIEIAHRRHENQLRWWSLRLHHEHEPTRVISEILDDDRVVFFEKHWEAAPDFGATPETEPVTRREAAEYLGRELLNRRGGGRLMRRHGGSLAALFVELAGALREARCRKVYVGGCSATADLIEELVAPGS